MNGPRLLLNAIASRRRDLVQKAIDAFPPVGDLSEDQDLKWWAVGDEHSANFAAVILTRRLRHDYDLLKQIEDALLDKMLGGTDATGSEP